MPDDEDGVQVTFVDVLYLGGLPEAPDPDRRKRRLMLASTWGVGYATGPDDGPVCEWDDVTCVGVDGGEVAKRKVGAVVAFGVLGGLGAKGTKDRSYIIVTMADGAEGIWQLDKMSPMRVRAAIGPVLHEVGVPFADSAGPGGETHPMSVADELTKLADLRERGFLTAEEFDAQKRRVLTGTWEDNEAWDRESGSSEG